MKIGIISDTHGSLTAWQLAVENCFQTVDLVIHCGDLLYHGPRNPLPEGHNPKQLALAINQFAKPLVIVKGNCDAEVDQMVLDYPLESPYAHILTPEYRILAHHGHAFTPENFPLKATRCGGSPFILISGHTHIPEIKPMGGLLLLNPGSPALPKSESGARAPQKTVALIDGAAIAILNIENGEPLTRYHLA